MLCIMVLSTATGMLFMDLATLAMDMKDMVRCTLDTRDMAMPRNCPLLEGLDMLLKASLPDSSTNARYIGHGSPYVPYTARYKAYKKL